MFLAGEFKGKNLVKIDVKDEDNLNFEGEQIDEPEESEAPEVAAQQ